MVVFQHRAWRLLTAYEKIVGSWPYQRNFKKHGIRIFLFFILITMLTALCIRLVKDIGINFVIVIENTDVALLTIVTMVKLVMPLFYEKQRRTIYEKVVKHVESIKDENEVTVLKKCSDSGLKCALTYTVVITSATTVFFILPIVKTLYNYLTEISELDAVMPLSIDYVFFDEQEYYYYSLIHIFLYLATCIIITLAFDSAFIMGVSHVCALFEIMRIRLNRASDILDRVKNLKNFIVLENEVNNLLKSAIDMHNEALHMAVLLEAVYNLSWFFILILNTIIVGITLFGNSLGLNDPLISLRYIMANIVFLVHFYAIFSQGQRVINSSSSVFAKCYNCTWYNAPKYSRTLLLLIMNRSLKPCVITGGSGLFILSMETYGQMLKFGFSIFTLFKSMK